jgi:hypothetical protein
MSLRSTLSLAVVAAATLSISTLTAHAAPIGVDGTIGAEWAGVTPIHVNHVDGAPESNFNGPVNETDSFGYNIYVRDDGSYYYVGLQADSDASSLPFGNIYLGNPVDGAFLGFEINGAALTSDAFIPGGANYYYPAGSYGITVASNFGGAGNTTIEFAVPNSFFLDNPLAIPGLPTKIADGAGLLELRDSQSFGYTYSGDTAPADAAVRYGVASVTPEPASLALLGAGALTLMARRRRTA